MEQTINLSPLADAEGVTTDRGSFSHGQHANNRSAMELIRNRLSNRSQSSPVIGNLKSRSPVRGMDLTEQELFQSKMRVLTKNPAIFHVFKDRLAAASGASSHSKEGIHLMLHDFLDNYLRIPELREEITRAACESLHKRRGRGRLSILAYLGRDPSHSTHYGKLTEKTIASHTIKVIGAKADCVLPLVELPEHGENDHDICTDDESESTGDSLSLESL